VSVVEDEIDKSFWGELESESSEEESEEEEEEERDLESGLVTPGETSVSYLILLSVILLLWSFNICVQTYFTQVDGRCWQSR